MNDRAALGSWIRRFLMEHLVGERNLARNTQQSYRDAVRLLVVFASLKTHKKVDDLLIPDIDADLLRAFLHHIEEKRKCSVSSRNQRLAAIHALASFIAERCPEYLDWCARLRTVRVKRTAPRPVCYLEGLLSIEQLRDRMPLLRQRERAVRTEIQAIVDQTADRAAFLRLAETLTSFLARLRNAADTLSVTERQRIVRLVVKEVLIGENTIVIRHSIPIPSSPPHNDGTQPQDQPNYLLCKGRGSAVVGERLSALLARSVDTGMAAAAGLR